MFMLKNITVMFTFVALKRCLSVDGRIGHHSYIEPSVTRGLHRGKGLMVKE